MFIELNFLYGIAFGILQNEPKQLTILFGIIGIDVYWK